MICPACSGKKYRDLRIRPDEGLCPKCEGAGSVKEDGKEGSWLFNYVPCPECSKRGIKSLISGGKPLTEAMVMASGGGAPFTGMGGRVSDTDVEVEEDTEPEEEPEDDRGFISKYRWYLVGGGGLLLVVALLASQGSKRK